MIWAQSTNGVIGRDGSMPWSLPEDMAFFRRTTTGHPVIMGRRTWESFPERFRPLPGRTNIVITSSPERVEHGRSPGSVLTAPSYAEAVRLARSSPGAERIWVIGGGEVYAFCLGQAERMHLTHVDTEVEDADAFFPVFDPVHWEVIAREVHAADAKHACAFEFIDYRRVAAEQFL